MAIVAAPELLAERGRHFGEARIRATNEVASDVRMIEIEPAAGVRPYPSGSHLDIAVEVDALPDVRSYSLVGDGPVDGAYRIAVKEIQDSRGGSVFVRALEPGTDVQVSEPQSHFELQYGRAEYLLVAGGIGITPIVGMAHALERHGRPFRLLFAARTREQMAFLDELSELLGDRLELFVSAEGNRLDLGREIDRLHPDGELYLCGPQRLRDAAIRGGGRGSAGPTGCSSRPSRPAGSSLPRSSWPACATRIARSRCGPTGRCWTRSRTTAST